MTIAETCTICFQLLGSAYFQIVRQWRQLHTTRSALTNSPATAGPTWQAVEVALFGMHCIAFQVSEDLIDAGSNISAASLSAASPSDLALPSPSAAAFVNSFFADQKADSLGSGTALNPNQIKAYNSALEEFFDWIFTPNALPSHPMVLAAACRTIASYAVWFRMNPGYIQKALTFFVAASKIRLPRELAEATSSTSSTSFISASTAAAHFSEWCASPLLSPASQTDAFLSVSAAAFHSVCQAWRRVMSGNGADLEQLIKYCQTQLGLGQLPMSAAGAILPSTQRVFLEGLCSIIAASIPVCLNVHKLQTQLPQVVEASQRAQRCLTTLLLPVVQSIQQLLQQVLSFLFIFIA